MEIIKINNKEYYRFKIGDEFEAISGKGSFNKMKKEGLTNETYDEEKGFIYPFYDSSTQNNHIKGYCKEYNFDGEGIKVSISGDAGKSYFIYGKMFLGSDSLIIQSNEFNNYYVGFYVNVILPKFSQGTAIKHVYFTNFKNEYITIPKNHQELSDIIKKILDYQQLSQQLSQQLKDYKLAILQYADKKIKSYINNNQHDKYIRFKIGDEFEAISGKGSFNKMKKEGLTNETYDEEKGFIYPFYDSSTQNNHIKGYCKEYNVDKNSIKVSKTGNSLFKSIEGASAIDNTPAGSSIFIEGKSYYGDAAMAFTSNLYSNYYMGLYFNSYIPRFEQGTNGLHNVYFSSIKNNFITIPKNHQELSDIIKKINNWEKLINITTNKMNTYIKGVLQLSLKGVKNEW